MADIRIPEEIITWMTSRNWGPHHVEYHTVKRWDIWHHRAAGGDQGAIAVVNFMNDRGWQRPAIQEGGTGDGLEFLAMHRAMLLLIKQQFPMHAPWFEGWNSPPTDPSDAGDPVANNSAFEAQKIEAIRLIQTDANFFLSEDHFGIFTETNIQPTPANPDNRTKDRRYGVHNYLHGRWTDTTSPVNLGDPEVNIFNARFWKLHGWIDKAWTTFRGRRGLSDDEPQYKSTIERYTEMIIRIFNYTLFE